jgi:tRNA threonylcarbamoyladenosine modification (KEOPS) complex  Pcc1 subunit
MKAVATVRLKFQRKQHLSAIFRALEPETRTSVSSRSKVTVRKEDNTLVLVFEAKDTSALRAALNSYLHWVRLARDVLDNLSRNA